MTETLAELLAARAPEETEALIADLDNQIERVLAILCPPETCEGLPDSFWLSGAGQQLAEAQWRRYGSEALTYADAAAVLFPEEEGRARIFRLRYLVRAGRLQSYVKPLSAFPPAPPSRKRGARGEILKGKGIRYVRASDVERLRREG